MYYGSAFLHITTMPSDAIVREKPSTKVVRAVAAYEGVDPTKFDEPLYDVIDLEALDSLFTERPNGESRADGYVTFTYGDYEVTVSSDGRVDVNSLDEA